MKTFFALLALLPLSLPSPASAGHIFPESYYQELWCNAHQGRLEVVLADGTRADCVTDTHAVEFDFGQKWAESIGQALNYSMLTGLDAGIVLILETPEQVEYYDRVRAIFNHYGIKCKVWIMK